MALMLSYAKLCLLSVCSDFDWLSEHFGMCLILCFACWCCVVVTCVCTHHTCNCTCTTYSHTDRQIDRQTDRQTAPRQFYNNWCVKTQVTTTQHQQARNTFRNVRKVNQRQSKHSINTALHTTTSTPLNIT